MSDDATLLRRYAETRAEDAFAELVRRHIDGVYSAALRRVGGDVQLAEDVAQQVFVVLARNATALIGHPALPVWLYVTTRNEAGNVVRRERRRKAREQEAQTMEQLSSEGETLADWSRVAPVLDAAIDQLGHADRTAVLLRFVDRRAFAEIGRALQLSEDAARMRVERALEKLRVALARRGVTSTASALAVVLTQQATMAAPAGLAVSVTGAALTGASVVGPAATVLSFMSTMKTAGVIVVVVAGATGLWWQQRANARLEAEVAALQKQKTTAAAPRTEAALVKTAPPVPASASAPAPSFMAPTVGNGAPASPATALAIGLKPVTNAGTKTAKATVETLQWAMNNGDVATVAAIMAPLALVSGETLKRVFTSLPPEKQAQFGTVEQMVAMALCASPQVTGMQVLAEREGNGPWKTPSGDEKVDNNPLKQGHAESLRVQLQYADGRVTQQDISLQWLQGQWQTRVTGQVADQVIASLGVPSPPKEPRLPTPPPKPIEGPVRPRPRPSP